MQIEIYIGTVWSSGSSGEWYTAYVETPDELQCNEDAITAHISKWIDDNDIECAFWGIYNIPSQLEFD